jgi:hypothetical protein
MENSTLEHLIVQACSVLNGLRGLELRTELSGQFGMLSAACQYCLVDCQGFVENCPHPEGWPEITLYTGLNGENVSLEGSSVNRGVMSGYFIIRDQHRKIIHTAECELSLPYNN